LKKVVNGPFTFSPDGNPLVGPVKGVPNYWNACAVMAGFSQGGGIGLVLSRWIAEGDPGQDVLAMDSARYGVFATPKYTSIKVQENYRRRFRLLYPNEEMPAARPFRRSPVYDLLDQRGAVWGANFGLENPLWFAPHGVAPVEEPTYRRSNAFTHVKAECHAVRTQVGLYETTNYAKYEITGKGARSWLDRVFACRIPRPGRMAIAPMLNPRGTIMGDLSIACLDEERFMIVGSGFAEAFHMRWFWQSKPPADVFVRSACSSLTGFALSGPNARGVLERVAEFDVSKEGFKFFAVREGAVGMSPAIVQRCGFTGELGFEIWVTPDYQIQLFKDLMEAGADLGLTLYGGRAISCLRMEKNYGSFNKDFRPDYTPGETGLDIFIDFTKNADFVGRAAATAEKATGPKRRFVTMVVDAPHADVTGYEVILRDGKSVGNVTSGAFGHWVGKSLAAGYVQVDCANDGQELFIDVLGMECRAVVTGRALHDPEGLRLRA
jgi:dimethylglycine dehydrogenase